MSEPGKLIEGRGGKPSLIAILGEQPGPVEGDMGRPFVGPSGKEMNVSLRRAGLSRRDCYVDNLYPWYRPNAEGLTEADIKLARPRLRETLQAVRPSLVAAMGRFITRELVGEDVMMEAVHGQPYYGVSYAGMAFTVVPCYHPAAGLHDPKSPMAARSADDIRILGLVSRGDCIPEIRDTYTPVYKLLSLLEERGAAPGAWAGGVLGLCLPFDTRGQDLRLYVDTEGSIRRPKCISFSFAPGTGYVIMADEPKLLSFLWNWIKAHGPRLVFHYAPADIPVLRVLGFDAYEYEEGFDDTHLKAFQMQLEPAGLKALCYRHHRMKMQDYEDLIRPYDVKQARQYLLRAYQLSEDLPRPDPVMEIKHGVPKVKKPMHVNRRIETVLAKDNPRRAWYDNVEPEIRRPTEELAGPMPEFSLDLVPLDKLVHYSARDADGTCRVEPVLDELLEPKQLISYNIDLDAVSMFVRMSEVGMLLDPQVLLDLEAEVEQRQVVLRRQMEKWAGPHFNPMSREQVAAILYTKLGFSTAIRTKILKEESTNDKALEGLRHAHPLVALILDYRELEIIRTRYTYSLIKTADAHHRIHPRWRLAEVVTGRPSCTDPNLLAIPVRGVYGPRVRAAFIAGPGHKMIDVDLNQVEMRFMAHESGDEKLIGRFRRGEDVHSLTAHEVMGVPLQDVIDDKKTNRGMKYREPAKRVGFGIITGITGRGIREQFELNGITGWTDDGCEELRQGWFGVYRGVKSYIYACHDEAERLGYTEDRWGRRRLLPGIYSQIPKVRAEAERASHSHKIQGGAAGFMKRIMKRVWDRRHEPCMEGAEPLLQVYDALTMVAPAERAEQVKKLIEEEMVRDSKMLKVPLTAEGKVGDNWGQLK